jgi:DNA-binding MarR family transcriptional regulator
LQSGPLTSTELSTKLGLDLSSTTRLVDELVKKKFVIRSRGVNDARVRKIELTAAARKLMARIEEDFSAILENAVAALPDSLITALPDVILRLNQALSCATEQSVILPGQIRKKAG